MGMCALWRWQVRLEGWETTALAFVAGALLGAGWRMMVGLLFGGFGRDPGLGRDHAPDGGGKEFQSYVRREYGNKD